MEMLYCNEQLIPVFKYPNGELGIKVKDVIRTLEEINWITLKYEGNDDIIALIFLKGWLDELGLEASLNIYYVPYSRMDREDGNNLFTLKQFCGIINYLNFKCVVMYEAHSDVTPALINRSVSFPIDLDSIINEILPNEGFSFRVDTDFIALPDAGAQKRYDVPESYNTITGMKRRNPSDGKIEFLGLLGKNMERLPGSTVVIVDDICSKGYTFLEMAKQLKVLGVGKILLVVAHCENSVYDGELFTSGLIDMLFTTSTILDSTPKNDKIRIYDPEEGGFFVA